SMPIRAPKFARSGIRFRSTVATNVAMSEVSAVMTCSLSILLGPPCGDDALTARLHETYRRGSVDTTSISRWEQRRNHAPAEGQGCDRRGRGGDRRRLEQRPGDGCAVRPRR